MTATSLLLGLVESGVVPDAVVRAGIRRLCAERLRTERRGSGAERARAFQDLVYGLSAGPVALVPEKANEQHYEMPPEFMALALGARMKYSCAWYPNGNETLDRAEEAMLALTCDRAQLADGQDVLELGCGWGSLTLWMAERYPRSRITAVSNSAPQRAYIEAQARARGLGNVSVLTRDMNVFAADGRFDRVVSVEMFEHMRNYPELLRRISTWLKPGGKLFVHVFCHREVAYPFVDQAGDDWMARHFFAGGLMPSESLLPRFQDHVALEHLWVVDGTHYEKTAEHWLENLDRRRGEALSSLWAFHGKDAAVWFQRWRVFYMSCAELFGYANGEEWRVAHYRFRRRDA
jgi:cyclopropane-fatty-acyl-phospholipid synthase